MEPPLHVLRYTAAVLLGLAICKLFPSAKLFSGGGSELGFYYDFVVEVPLDDSFLIMLEETMHGLAKEGLPITCREMMRENAVDFFLYRQQPLKAELVEMSPYNIVQLIEIADFIDLAPPHFAESIDCVTTFKIYDLEKIVCSSKQGHFPAFRATGEVFSDKQKLKKFMKQLKEDKVSGHRVLAKAMELFVFDEDVSNLQYAWLPKGVAMREILLSVWKRDGELHGIMPVVTPELIKADLFQKNEMAFTQEVVFEVSTEIEDYRAMQMPAEAHAHLYKAKSRQVFELPIRYSEVKDIYVDHSLKTQLAGVLKSPSQLIDFTNSFCAPEHLREELISSLQFIQKMGKLLGLEYQWNLCSRKGKSAGRQKQWDQAVALMHEALRTSNCIYADETFENAPFGPFLRGDYVDRLGRKWRGPQVTVDFHLPSHLGLCYINPEGQKVPPVLLRQSTYGPLERLIALLIEKDGGKLPLWLTPEQVRVISIGDGLLTYAKTVLRQLQQAGVRATGDLRSHSLGCSLGMKIHEFECAKVPYALIVGNNEEREKIVNVRKCGCTSTALKMDLDSFIQQLLQEHGFLVPERTTQPTVTEAINRSRAVES